MPGFFLQQGASNTENDRYRGVSRPIPCMTWPDDDLMEIYEELKKLKTRMHQQIGGSQLVCIVLWIFSDQDKLPF